MLDNITSFIGCCKRDKSNCSGNEIVVKTGFDNDEMQVATDEEENGIYLSDDGDTGSDEIYLPDEKDADTDEDGMEKTEEDKKQLNCGTKADGSVTLLLLEKRLEKLEKEEEQPNEEGHASKFCCSPLHRCGFPISNP